MSADPGRYGKALSCDFDFRLPFQSDFLTPMRFFAGVFARCYLSVAAISSSHFRTFRLLTHRHTLLLPAVRQYTHTKRVVVCLSGSVARPGLAGWNRLEQENTHTNTDEANAKKHTDMPLCAPDCSGTL